MNIYEWTKIAYPFSVTLEQMKQFVKLKGITKEQYKEITNLEYEE